MGRHLGLVDLEMMGLAAEGLALVTEGQITEGMSRLDEAARTAFEDATRLFHRLGAPFEAARARIELARALAGLSRDSDAIREVQAAATLTTPDRRSR